MIESLRVKIFADGARLDDVSALNSEFRVVGYTTNPTLMAAAGITDYLAFAEEMVSVATGLPVSFEVFADDPFEMIRQAKILSDLAPNVYVKIPITTTAGRSCADVIGELHSEGVSINATAVFTANQLAELHGVLTEKVPSIVSIFAGRIADAGIDPVPVCAGAVDLFRDRPNVEILWASCREIFNVVQADTAGCDIVTVPLEMLPKLRTLGKSLEDFSLDTVCMFHRDAESSGFSL